MHMLIHLNVSNRSNLNADSGFVFQKLLINEILKRRPDWNIYLLCPENSPEINEKVQYIPLATGFNKYEVRFNFDWRFLEKKIKELLPDLDIIYINQSEQTENFFALINSVNAKKIKLVTYFHYLTIVPEKDGIEYDSSLNHGGLGEIILNRQVNALKVSNSSIICSQFGRALFEKGARELLNRTIENTLSVIPPAVSAAEAEQGYTADQFDTPTIVYNHRLYKHYGTETFFTWMDEYYRDYSQQVQVVVTDPTFGRSQKRIQLDPHVSKIKKWIEALPFVVHKHSATRDEYYRTIHRSHIGIGPLKPSALWSMSVVDAMVCRKPVLCSRYAAFPEIVGDKADLLFSSKKEFFEKLTALLDGGDRYQENAEYCKKRADMFDIKKTVHKFLEVFEE